MNNYLEHYGIMGMHWGIRRFQPYPKGHVGGKEVGEAAKAKHRRDSDQTSVRAESRAKKKEMKQAAKNRHALSDEELRRRIDRLQTEKKLKELTEEELSPGKAFTRRVIAKTGEQVLTNAIKGGMSYTLKLLTENSGVLYKEARRSGGPNTDNIKKAIKSSFKPSDFSSYVAPNPNKKK